MYPFSVIGNYLCQVLVIPKLIIIHFQVKWIGRLYISVIPTFAIKTLWCCGEKAYHFHEAWCWFVIITLHCKYFLMGQKCKSLNNIIYLTTSLRTSLLQAVVIIIWLRYMCTLACLSVKWLQLLGHQDTSRIASHFMHINNDNNIISVSLHTYFDWTSISLVRRNKDKEGHEVSS